MVSEIISRCSSQAVWPSLPSFHRFKSIAKIARRFHSRVWFWLTSTRPTDLLGVLPHRPILRLLDQPTVSLDLDLTANDPRVRPNHALSLILVAVIHAHRNCRQLRLGEFA